jgi:hypothetical protein
MGPIALFDKSFLQSLNVDESVWFDQFFIANISPLFYIETLADLDKEMTRGRTAEQVVGDIASKTPELSGAPNVHHQYLLLGNLMGQPVSMSNRPLVAGGRPVESGGKKGVNIDISPEAKAFSRWQNGEYQQLEREFAKLWRANLKSLTFESSAIYAEKLGIDISQCKNYNDAFRVATDIVTKSGKPYDLIEFIVTSLAIPRKYHQQLVRNYQTANFPPLSQFAPYAAHVIKVEIFFHICVSRGFISADRPSNKIDIAYLHYLPFCNVFISGDKLHRSTAPLFLTGNQKFVWAPDLKADLSKINDHFMELPDEVKDKGIMSFASKPPAEGNYLTAELWDIMNPNWRTLGKNMTPLSEEANEKILKHVKGFTEAQTLPPEMMLDPTEEIDNLSIQRSIKKKRGSWYQIPKDYEND